MPKREKSVDWTGKQGCRSALVAIGQVYRPTGLLVYRPTDQKNDCRASPDSVQLTFELAKWLRWLIVHVIGFRLRPSVPTALNHQLRDPDQVLKPRSRLRRNA